MSEANPRPNDETVWQEVRDDRLCDRYEFLLLAGRPVRVPDFLRDEGVDPDSAGPELLRELARLEAAYQPGGGVEPADVGVGVLLGGRYSLVERIGSGGMGEVWRAQQTTPVRRAVAVKLIKRGMDSKAVLARFDAERQALAVMDHTNIAKVFDGGSTPGGQPYFVMELVEGVPITQFCDERKLTPRQRLELFVPVCLAIQHAHQKGVIHRDVKPSNVLVTLVDDRPVPKVIDFGVAKAVGERLTDLTVATGHGVLVGTPEYMSPEQATFDNPDVDTRSDVYSLGVLLYELLTGTTPLDRKSLPRVILTELLRKVREEDAPRPSDRLSSSAHLPGIAATRGTEPKKLTGEFRGEVDWIVLKALEKDRDRRYGSPLAFAADVQRHLADEEVEARPPTPGYRLRKFVRRNRGPVLAGLAVFVALLGGVIGTALGLVEANHRRDEANDARGREAVQRGIADANAADAKRKADDLADQLAESERRIDLGRLREAEADLERNAVRSAADKLAAIAPQNRCIAWGLLNRRLQGGDFILWGHTDAVSSVTYSPDGRRVVTGSHDQTARVWDAVTGQPLLVLKGHAGWVNCVAFSPDGRRVATGGDDGFVRMWDADTGQKMMELKTHDQRVTSVAFSPDGRRVVTGSWDKTAKVWDAATGQSLLMLTGHTHNVMSVGFSPEGTRIVTGSWDQSARVWDAGTGRMLLELKGHILGVTGVAYSPDGQRVATGSWDGTARVWDAITGRSLFELKGHTQGSVGVCVAFSPDGRRGVTGGDDHTVRMWDTTAGQSLLEWKGHTNVVTSVGFSPDGRRVVTGSRDGSARVWDADTGQSVVEVGEIKPAAEGQGLALTGFAASPDGRRVVTGSWDNRVRVWDADTGQSLLELKGHTSWLTCVAFSPDGRRVVTGSRSGTAHVRDANTGQPLLELKEPKAGWETVVAFSPDGRRVVTGSRSDTAHVWDANTGQPLLELKGHAIYVSCVAFSLDGRRVVTGDYNGVVRLWDADTGQLASELKGHTLSVGRVAFSPDGRRVVTGSDDTTARVWDTATGESLVELKGHTTSVSGVAFSPDGRRVITGSFDHTVRVWDTVTGDSLLVLKSRTDAVSSVVFSQSFVELKGILGKVTGVGIDLNGRRVIAGLYGGAARVWDTDTSPTMVTLNGHIPAVWGVGFSPNGQRVVIGEGYSKIARVWDTNTGRCIAELKGHSGFGNGGAFSPDGKRVAALADDGTVQVWDADTGRSLLELRGHKSPRGVESVGFSPDGRRVVAGCRDGTVRVWDADTGHPPLELMGHTQGVFCVAFSPDGRRIVTGSRDNTARVWDADTGRSLLELKGHTGWVQSVAFSPDGRRVVTRSKTDTTRVWDAGTGEHLPGENLPDVVIDENVSPDGRFLVRNDGRMVIVDPRISPEELIRRRRLARPRPDRHAKLAEEYKADPFAAAVQKSFEQQARAELAVEAGDFRLASGHFLAAELLRPNPTSRKQPPQDSTSWYLLGIHHQQQKDYRRAADAFRKAVKADTRPLPDPGTPDPTGVVTNRLTMLAALGSSLREVGDLTGAETVYRQALELLDDEWGFRAPAGRKPIGLTVVTDFAVCLIRQKKVKEANAECGPIVDRVFASVRKQAKSATPGREIDVQVSLAELGKDTTQIASHFLWADYWAEARDWADRAILLWDEYDNRWKLPPAAIRPSGQAFQLKAIALNWLDDGKGAVAAIDKSIERSVAADKPYQRMMRARYVAKTGDHLEAVRQVKAEQAAGNTNTWDAAQAYALCVKAVKGDEKLQEEYAREAVVLLRKTLDAKGFGYPWKRDADLNPIRDRADFKAVLAEFEKLTAPKPQPPK